MNVNIDKRECWVVKGKASDSLLSHERLHYRMAVIAAYELEVEMLALQAPDARALRAAMSRALTAKHSKLAAVGKKYDAETKSSADTAAQQRWENQIAGWEQSKRLPG
jgi:hypothetical protein